MNPETFPIDKGISQKDSFPFWHTIGYRRRMSFFSHDVGTRELGINKKRFKGEGRWISYTNRDEYNHNTL